MLGRIYNHEIAYAVYGAFVNTCGRNLFNPTEQTYLDLGFYTLPELEPQEGYHTAWRIAIREVIPPEPETWEDIIPEEAETEDALKDDEDEEPTPEPEPQYEEYIEAYYEADPEPEDPEEVAKRREATFKEQFFKTSLGWVRKRATMKDGSVDNFINDDLPLLALGMQSGAEAKVIVYATPDFTIDFDILDYQSYVLVTPQFIAECLQEKQNEFRDTEGR